MDVSRRNWVFLVAGIPAAGKSAFSEYLHRERGWLHLDIDDLVGRSKPWPSVALQQSWNEAIQTNDPAVLVQACRQTTKNVVIDWGFPIQRIPFVRGLAAQGMRIFGSMEM